MKHALIIGGGLLLAGWVLHELAALIERTAKNLQPAAANDAQAAANVAQGASNVASILGGLDAG